MLWKTLVFPFFFISVIQVWEAYANIPFYLECWLTIDNLYVSHSSWAIVIRLHQNNCCNNILTVYEFDYQEGLTISSITRVAALVLANKTFCLTLFTSSSFGLYSPVLFQIPREETRQKLADQVILILLYFGHIRPVCPVWQPLVEPDIAVFALY